MRQLIVIGLVAVWATSAQAEDTANARALCSIIDGTGLASAPCEIAVWDAAVVATIDMAASEARDLCPKVAGMMADHGRTFDRDWTLRIKSPYSGDNSIAFCKLPR